MKAYLKPEDEQECLRMVKSLDLCLVIFNFDQWLRSEIKYQNEPYQLARDKLYETMDEYGINLDELIT